MPKAKTGIRRMGAPPKPLSKRTPPRRTTTRPLTPKQANFLERYMLTLNATQAYQEAFPDASWATADTNGSALLKDTRIASEVKRRLALVNARYRPTADRILSELSSLAFSDVRELFDSDGALIPPHKLPARVTAAMKKVKSKEITAIDLVSGEEKVIGHLREVEMIDKVRPLNLLGVHESLFVEKVQVSVGKEFAEALRDARARTAKQEA